MRNAEPAISFQPMAIVPRRWIAAQTLDDDRLE
jgi:hypothetical protein